MVAFHVERKEAFRVIGFKTVLEGGTGIHSPEYSGQKTAFFKSKVENGQMAQLRRYAESPLGIAVVAAENGRCCYYAGVISSRPLPEGTGEVHFPAGEVLVLSGSGGLSRLAFDRLEDYAFGTLLKDGLAHDGAAYEYTGGPVAEILLNGNPADAEVEVWIPVRKREGR